MVLIRVEYDAYNRRFKLLDRELAPLLEDGERYLLVGDIAVTDLDPASLIAIDSKSMTALPGGRCELRPFSETVKKDLC